MNRPRKRKNPRRGDGTGFQSADESNQFASIIAAADQSLPDNAPIIRIQREAMRFCVTIDPAGGCARSNRRVLFARYMDAWRDAMTIRAQKGYAILDTSMPWPRLVVDNGDLQ